MNITLGNTQLDWAALQRANLDSPAGVAHAYAQANPNANVDESGLANLIAQRLGSGLGPSDRFDLTGHFSISTAELSLVVVPKNRDVAMQQASLDRGPQGMNVAQQQSSLPSNQAPALSQVQQQDMQGAFLAFGVPKAPPQPFVVEARRKLQEAEATLGQGGDPRPALEAGVELALQGLVYPSLEADSKALLLKSLPLVIEQCQKHNDGLGLVHAAAFHARVAPPDAGGSALVKAMQFAEKAGQWGAVLEGSKQLFALAHRHLGSDGSPTPISLALTKAGAEAIARIVPQAKDPQLTLDAAAALLHSGNPSLVEPARELGKRAAERFGNLADTAGMLRAAEVFADLGQKDLAVAVIKAAIPAALGETNLEALRVLLELDGDVDPEGAKNRLPSVLSALGKIAGKAKDPELVLGIAEALAEVAPEARVKFLQGALEFAKANRDVPAVASLVGTLLQSDNPGLVKVGLDLAGSLYKECVSGKPQRLDLAEQVIVFLSQVELPSDGPRPHPLMERIAQLGKDLQGHYDGVIAELLKQSQVSKAATQPLAIRALFDARDTFLKTKQGITLGDRPYTFAGGSGNIFTHAGGGQPDYPDLLARVLNSVGNDGKAFANLMLRYIDGDLDQAPVAVRDIIVITCVSEYDRDPRIPGQLVSYLEALQTRDGQLSVATIRDACPWMHTMDLYRSKHGPRAATGQVVRNGAPVQAVAANPVSAAFESASGLAAQFGKNLARTIKDVDLKSGLRLDDNKRERLLAFHHGKVSGVLAKFNRDLATLGLSPAEKANLQQIIASKLKSINADLQKQGLAFQLSVAVSDTGVLTARASDID